ncbi:AAA family ATPase [Pseudooceanicola marinus]|uniref:AAA family ATPase n=1 Tax=Pseudooceanicola marinus TaxID=396013 RepID=UPI001CD21E75|nr:ATP-binding protein [Pseudooceanicola marinus]MCA1337855.1 AAA family ATPase [Pseudooceanicola marinus]
MLRRIDLKNWKSFSEASLNIERLTVLIGTNASGKSNALDALEFLARTAHGLELGAAIGGNATINGIRGELEWAAHKNADKFTLNVVVGTEDEKTDYEYSITVAIIEGGAELSGEELTRVKYQGSNPRPLRLFWTDNAEKDAPGITARLYNKKSGSKRPLRRNVSILSQLDLDPDLRQEIKDGINLTIKSLRDVFILDPNPGAMRDFSRLSETLQKDGANLAGVIMALDGDRREKIEKAITELASNIPEKDITRVWCEYVGRHKSDAMLYCEEAWRDDEVFEVDARGMSDGTLRFICVVSTLLLRPQGSTVVIEEIDNGLHPSRALTLLNAISKISESRQIELIITTHNVALLDSLPPSRIRSISVAARSPYSGASTIVSLDDVPLLAGLIAEGEVGKLSKNGRLEEQLKKVMQDGR